MTDVQTHGVAHGISTTPQELLEKTQQLIEHLEKLRAYVVVKENAAEAIQHRLHPTVQSGSQIV